ncbi:MAG TPA: hypothetical protein QGH10_00450 [Armatimonadota bacterium]|nr:hypothetical protein [Armatimonadota bacterium]
MSARSCVNAAVVCIGLGVAMSGAAAQDDPTAPLKWNPETVAAELQRYEPALAEFGIQDPLRWARARVKQEDDWAVAQGYWERRIAHWRLMLLDDDPASWSRWLNLDHPSLADRRDEIQKGGDRARQAWAGHVRGVKPDLLSISDNADLRYLSLRLIPSQPPQARSRRGVAVRHDRRVTPAQIELGSARMG